MPPMDRLPLATFVHCSDLHLGTQHDAKFALAGARADCLRADIRAAAPDWVVVSGDLTARGAVDPAEADAVHAWLDGLGPAWDALPGNHDLCPSPSQEARFPGIERYEPVPLRETAYGRAFGEPGLRFGRTLGGVRFLGVTLRAGDPDAELERLAAALRDPAARGARARVVVGHYPVAPVRTAGPLAAWGPGHIGATAAELERVLVAGAVDAYLFGHVHVLAAAERAGVRHLTPGAVAVGCPGFRLCAIHEDRIEFRFLPLSRPDLASCGFWAAAASTDPDHPDAEMYHAGTAAERAVVVRLPGTGGGAVAG
jgi:3',5'-cyclic AMP phosphodiesterase CpdA